MADVTQNVIIEFITNDEQLKSSEQRLADLGKIDKTVGDTFKLTNSEINKQAAALKNVSAATSQIQTTGKATQKNISDVATAVKGMSGTFQKEFKRGVIDELKKAGVTLKEFEQKVGTSFGASESATLSLRSQLRAMVEQLAQLKVQGKDTGQEYLDLAQKAGQLKDAIADANQQVSGFGSDTRHIDGLIQGVQGLAGGFAIVQGATALFGDESEELQKTLLRVNAAMAILQGLQSIQNVLQKESAASQLANTIATKAQAAAQVAWNFVIGTSTGLLKAFRIALAATGVGLLVIGIMELVKAFQSSNSEMEDANRLIERQKALLDDLNTTVQQRTDVEIARLRAASAAESEITRAQGRALVIQRDALRNANRDLSKQMDLLSAVAKLGANTSKAWNELNLEIEKNTKSLQELDNQITVAGINLEKQLADERKDAADKRLDDAKKFAEDAKRRREEQLQKEKEARAAGFADNKAFIELQLLAVEKGSQEELRIKKELLRAELQQALDNDKLTDNQRKLLVKQFFKERLDLEKQFAKDRDKIILENINSDIQAELQGLELSNERRLELQETAIQIAAQLEIDAAEGNAAKIKEINAKMDKAIRDARILSIQQALDYELAVSDVANAAAIRAMQRRLDDEKTSVQDRINIINALAEIQSAAIQKRIKALNKEKTDGLITQKDYNLRYAQLVDQQTQVWEDSEKKKTDATKKGNKDRDADNLRSFKDAILVAQGVAEILAGVFSLQSDFENNKLAESRQRIKDLQDAGAITEKEAIARMKRLDAEEKRIKTQQAQRDKALALFNAVISTAKGIAEAIPNAFLIALAAAVGAAQIAIIAARPIPKFGKGKKNQYEGLAEVGETGTELIESNGRMRVVKQREIVWLSKKDKVFNPVETAAMMTQPKMSTERNGAAIVNNKGVEIDYDKMGEAVGKHVQQNIIIDGVTAQVIKQRDFTNYLDGRRSF